MGFTPANAAKAASERTLPWCEYEMSTWVADTGPTPGRSIRTDIDPESETLSEFRLAS